MSEGSDGGMGVPVAGLWGKMRSKGEFSGPERSSGMTLLTSSMLMYILFEKQREN